MEIISYVLEGGLAHKDSMGNGSVIRPGDVQRMSAGTGVRHSEYNASKDDQVHFLQIWIEPNELNVAPSYEEKNFDVASKRGKLRLVASRDAREGSVRIHQDADLYATLVNGDEVVEFQPAAGRRVYVHVVSGAANVNGQALAAGDAMKLWGGDNKLRIDRRAIPRSWSSTFLEPNNRKKGNHMSTNVQSMGGNTQVHTNAQDVAALVGRLLLAAIFITSGFGKITGFEGTVGYIASKGLPLPQVAAIIAIIVELGGGILLAIGYKARWAALALAVFTLAAGILFHNYWAVEAAQKMGQQINFWKNVAMTGGFLMAYAFGPGRYSLDRK
jgi:uncharacterized membrane protein YphA (DoxX/SURF4 family)